MKNTQELIQQAQQGDRAALEALISQNSGLIWSVVRKFTGRGFEAEDLYQIGSIGLLKCIKKFDLSFNVKFSTYAVPMIIGEIKRFIRDDGMIKVSRHLKELSYKAKFIEEKFTNKKGRKPTISEIADVLQVEVEDLVLALESRYEVESLYSTVQNDDNNTTYLIDKLDAGDESDAKMVNQILLKEAINKLKPKEQKIIINRYFHDKTQTEVANEIGVSQVQVSRIEKKVIEQMRMMLKESG